MKFLKPYSREFQKLCLRRFCIKKRVRDTVSKIIEDVAKYQDKALIYYTKKFDKVSFSPSQIKVSESEISSSFQGIDTKFITNLKSIIQRIFNYYRSQLKNFSTHYKTSDGSRIKEVKLPLDSVGIYVPAGQVPLISTVYMSAIPAIVAGVKRIVLVSPPSREGRINPYILVIASLLKIREIYKAGGAQAIASLALGTKSIPSVDKIIGPGNQYVSEAKRQVYGYVDIDMIAGPSELVVVATGSSNCDYIVSDLRAQEEHIGGLVILITSSSYLARLVKNRVSSGYIIMVNDMAKSYDIINKIAPEHLEVFVKNPYKFIKSVSNAGAIFLGESSPVVCGDYIAGPSHVLPTGGTSRFFSGLGLDTFYKKLHIINFSRKELEKVRPLIKMLAELEGLKNHLESLEVRFSK